MACRSLVGHRSKSKYHVLDALHHLSVEWLIKSLYGDSNQLTEASYSWLSLKEVEAER